jgi:tetratricopeptide (TPR) repeat protein
LAEAITQYEEALLLRPGYPQAHFNLGAALEQTGNLREAVAHYQQALKLEPDFTAASEALKRLGSAR